MPGMTTTEDVVVKKRLRIKYGTKKFEKECATSDVKSAQMVPLIDDWGHSLAVKGKSESLESEGYVVPSSVEVKFDESLNPNVKDSRKRGSSEMLESHKEKRQKMDRSISQQCSIMLKKLMTHKLGWPFLAPVDPVQLGIPDYFSVIKHPMDLGTIKSKLGKNKYNDANEFAADVRLIFSNAMTYNPPGNFVHVMAKDLNDLFNRMWKSVEKKMGQDQSKERTTKLTIGIKGSDSSQKLFVKAPAKEGTVNQKGNLPCHAIEKLTRPMGDDLPKSQDYFPTKTARPASFKGTDNGDKKTFDCTLSKLPLSSASTVCTICANSRYCCCIADISSGNSSSKNICPDSHISHEDFLTISKAACQRSNSDPESNGAGMILGDENTCHSSNLTTDASSEEEWQTPAIDIQLSPKRALRAAMLKSRFAGTILKAQQKKLLVHGDKVDALKIQQQKERLERKQREERIRLEAEIKAAKVAEQEKAEAERRAQREKEREAARIALQNMERTVEFHETIRALKEIEMLCGCPISPSKASNKVISKAHEKEGSFVNYTNPLQQLGLYMKDEYLGGDEDDPEDGEIRTKVDGEEGEFIP